MNTPHRLPMDAADRRRSMGLHDATCAGGQGPCDLCQADQEEQDRVVYPEPSLADVVLVNGPKVRQ